MIRDELMQRVIHREMEPITPFIERIRELYEQYDISTVIVAGSSGAYFHIADTIVQMDKYVPKEITDPAKREAENFPALSGPEEPAGHPRFEQHAAEPGIRKSGSDQDEDDGAGSRCRSIGRP